MNFLNLPGWEVIGIEESTGSFFISAKYEDSLSKCAGCSASLICLRKNGTRVRSFRDAPAFGKTVSGLLTIQGYVCNHCGTSFFAEPCQLTKSSRFTKRLVKYIERSAIFHSAVSVSKETGVAESSVRKIFDDFHKRIEDTRSRILPEIVGVDDVYISRVARCILVNGGKKQLFDILPRCDLPTVYGYLCGFESRRLVRLVTMDMHRPFYSTVRELMPQAEIVIDTFHVRRMINASVMTFLTKLRNSLGYSQRRLQMRDRFLLLKRNYNLTDEEKRKLSDWKKGIPAIGFIYELKESFLNLWQMKDRARAEIYYRQWCDRIKPELEFAFKDIRSTIRNWHHEIFNYFDYRITNAFAESSNRIIKDIQRSGCGISFETVRAKMICRSAIRLQELRNDSDFCDCLKGSSDSRCYCGLK